VTSQLSTESEQHFTKFPQNSGSPLAVVLLKRWFQTVNAAAAGSSASHGSANTLHCYQHVHLALQQLMVVYSANSLPSCVGRQKKQPSTVLHGRN
jgi:hypothetical protein